MSASIGPAVIVSFVSGSCGSCGSKQRDGPGVVTLGTLIYGSMGVAGGVNQAPSSYIDPSTKVQGYFRINTIL